MRGMHERNMSQFYLFDTISKLVMGMEVHGVAVGGWVQLVSPRAALFL